MFIIGSSNKVMKLEQRAEIGSEAVTDNEIGGKLSNGADLKKELQKAAEKIKHLEKRLQELDLAMPKKYKEVKFQNYKHRKRILVSET